MDGIHLCYVITVTGLVQGVGFRPMVAELAEKCQILGQVKNLGGVVEIIASGQKEAVEKFLHGLEVLPVGRINTMTVKEVDGMASFEGQGFSIVESKTGREAKRFLPVDFATCDRCKEEVFDPNNRRYRYPFISCTQCGPRYSIQRKVPYDRESITMGIFPMCSECEKEYKEKGNIRRHAQTIACHDCGPQLRLITSTKDTGVRVNKNVTERILAESVKAIQEEKILAMKDIGGFHFAFSPYSSKAASRLREFKARDKKPFAVMFFDIEQIREYCQVNEREEELLLSNARPIVLLDKNKINTIRKEFVPEICGDSDRIGAMLPCNPLQLLLLKETGPLVMTSGNRGGEPIITDDSDMADLMNLGCPDMILTHDREILTPLDDSIYQVNGEYVQLIRRARGLVPEPIEINRNLQQDTFGAGGDLKASFALGRDNLVYMSQYFGDLEDVRCTRRREEAYAWMKELLEMQPILALGDLHPSYVSAQNTQMKIQHHHAHVASVIAEHGLEGKVLGIACDGTGFGTDGTIWGCEVFLYDDRKAQPSKSATGEEMTYGAGTITRVGGLSPVKLLGGDASAKDADLTVFSYGMEACNRGIASEPWRSKAEDQSKSILQTMAWKQNINTVYSSSLGRLFDAVAAVLDICHYNSYEGECAILVEQAAHRGRELLQSQKGNYSKELRSDYVKKTDSLWQIDGVQLIADIKKQYDFNPNQRDVLAYAFHISVSQSLAEIAKRICQESGVTSIALSGGSFINRLLLSKMTEDLAQSGYAVYTNEKVPCGDGGIALGQMFLSSEHEREDVVCV